MFKHILVPTDGSGLSQAALQKAAEFAREIGARITALYAKPEFPVTFYVEGMPIDTATSEQFAEFAEKQAEAILNQVGDVCTAQGVTYRVLSETTDIPYEAIVEVAAREACDLIFMASHGRRGLSGFLLGSETYRVLTHSTIPVLVHRAPDVLD